MAECIDRSTEASALAHRLISEPFVLTEGAVIERLRRDPAVALDPFVLHAGLIYQLDPSKALARVYRGYLEVGRQYGLPMMVFAPTWRANPARLARTRFGQTARVNADAIRFLRDIVAGYGVYADHVTVGALMGCAGDAYSPNEALSVDEAYHFHQPQARSLADGGADLIVAATLPAFSEALGMARALGECTEAYALSFVLRPEGRLLDGMPLHQAVETIDGRVPRPPLFYMVNCVHPDVFAQAMSSELAASPLLRERVIGLQANTCALSPEELDNLSHLEGQDPARFAKAAVWLYDHLGTRVLGGCCGTDERHIAEIAARVVSRLYPDKARAMGIAVERE